jgi:phage anti-repressor protein
MEGLKIIESSLVPVYSDRDERIWINARDLHRFLESGRQFSNWIRDRIERYKFSEEEDYTSFNEIVKRESGGGTTRVEYLLSLEMAKEIAMLESNDKGRMIRRYFIECERRLKAAGSVISSGDAEKLRQRAKRLDIMERNARSRQAWILKSAAEFFKAILSDATMRAIVSEIAVLITGKRLVELPEAERLYPASEIGEMCGISAGMVERIAESLRLNTGEYGVFVLGESSRSEKRAAAFLYKRKAAEKIREFLDAVNSAPLEDIRLDDEFDLNGFYL